MRSKRFFTRYKARVRRRDARQCSAGLPDAICGQDARVIGRRRSADSATRNLWAWTGRVEAGSKQPRIWRRRSARRGLCAATEGTRFVVCTGGEPLLQLDRVLIDALHERDFEIAVETNGTVEAPAGIDWVCVSPKAGARLVLKAGDELKLVFPQAHAQPTEFEGLGFRHFFLQPMDGPDRLANTELAVRYCMEHPNWRLSLQTHKILGIP